MRKNLLSLSDHPILTSEAEDDHWPRIQVCEWFCCNLRDELAQRTTPVTPTFLEGNIFRPIKWHFLPISKQEKKKSN